MSHRRRLAHRRIYPGNTRTQPLEKSHFSSTWYLLCSFLFLSVARLSSLECAFSFSSCRSLACSLSLPHSFMRAHTHTHTKKNHHTHSFMIWDDSQLMQYSQFCEWPLYLPPRSATFLLSVFNRFNYWPSSVTVMNSNAMLQITPLCKAVLHSCFVWMCVLSL